MQELALAGVPFGLPQVTFGSKIPAKTLLRWSTEEYKSHFLPRILSGSRTRARTSPPSRLGRSGRAASG
jgi:hypothetical protein